MQHLCAVRCRRAVGPVDSLSASLKEMPIRQTTYLWAASLEGRWEKSRSTSAREMVCGEPVGIQTGDGDGEKGLCLHTLLYHNHHSHYIRSFSTGRL